MKEIDSGGLNPSRGPSAARAALPEGYAISTPPTSANTVSVQMPQGGAASRVVCER
jgi:hypothetical protein